MKKKAGTRVEHFPHSIPKSGNFRIPPSPSAHVKGRFEKRDESSRVEIRRGRPSTSPSVCESTSSGRPSTSPRVLGKPVYRGNDGGRVDIDPSRITNSRRRKCVSLIPIITRRRQGVRRVSLKIQMDSRRELTVRNNDRRWRNHGREETNGRRKSTSR